MTAPTDEWEFIPRSPHTHAEMEELRSKWEAPTPLEERITTLEQVAQYRKEEEQREKERHRTAALPTAVRELAVAFGVGGDSARVAVKKVFRQIHDPSTPPGRIYPALNPAAAAAFNQGAWEEEKLGWHYKRNPPALLLDLLELEDAGEVMAQDAVVFLLLAECRRGMSGDVDEEGVAGLMADVELCGGALPTPRQREWMARLGLGAMRACRL